MIRNGGAMDIIKKSTGVYLGGIAAVVAVYYIVTPFFSDSFDVNKVWDILDILMVIGLALALIFNYVGKREERRDSEGAVTRRYLEVNTLFYLTAGVTILFLHNWFSLLALGRDTMSDSDLPGIIWTVVDVMFPLVIGVTGCRLVCNGSR